MSLTTPNIYFFEFNTRELASPVGSRHTANGNFAFNSVLASGCSTYTTRNLPATSGIASSGTLLFPGTKINLADVTQDYIATTPVAIIARIETTDNTSISNLRFHLREDTAITIPAESVGLPPGFVQFASSGVWQPNCVLPSGAVTRLEKTRNPFGPANVYRQDGGPVIVGADDTNVSEFIYLNLILPVGFPLGVFGICGSGSLRFGLAFDYFLKDL